MTTKFKYKALNSDGEKIIDYIYSIDENSARLTLKKQNVIVISLAPENASNFLGIKNRASTTDLEESTSQLATLLENGLRINDALQVLVDTASSQALADIWTGVHSDVQAGSSLYEALNKYPELFDVLYLEMTNIAENTGTLPTVFRSLANNLAFQRDLKNKTIQALTYPLIIFFVCVTAILAIFNFVIPNMESVFASAKNLPGYTQWLLNSSRFVSQNNFLILSLFVGMIFIIVSLWSKNSTRQMLMMVISKLPLLGLLVEKAEQIRFCSAMSLTLESGLSLSNSLALSIKILTSDINKQQLKNLKIKVDNGASLAETLAQTYFLDRVSVALIKVGEESGALEHSFNEVTKRAKNSFESWMMKMTALLEPLLILIMGAIVGGVVIVMLLSIVSVNDLSM